MQRFLQYTVGETLAGRGHALKEYSVALNVYDKPATFDPRFDSIIRVEASRLRAKLKRYYEAEGQSDQVQVSFPRYRYEPQFDLRTRAQVAPSSDVRRLLLQGRHALNQYDPKSIGEAMRGFSDALQLAPVFAPTLTALAEAIAVSVWMEYVPPGRGWVNADAFARLALKHDPADTAARGVAACANALARWEWESAESEFGEILRLDPENASVHHWYGYFCLTPLGRLDEAEVELRRACELDAASAIARFHLGRVLHFKRSPGAAAEQFLRAIDSAPGLALAHWGLGEACVAMSQWSEARNAFQAALRLGDLPSALSGLGRMEALCGNADAAHNALRCLAELGVEHYVSPLNSIAVQCALGRMDAAIDDLVIATAERSVGLGRLAVDPAFDPLKTEGRFMRVLDEIRYPVIPRARAS
jgi:tetratricopeptide (TPR) repeat protein